LVNFQSNVAADNVGVIPFCAILLLPYLFLQVKSIIFAWLWWVSKAVLAAKTTRSRSYLFN